jgi:hypothetical protein
MSPSAYLGGPFQSPNLFMISPFSEGSNPAVAGLFMVCCFTAIRVAQHLSDLNVVFVQGGSTSRQLQRSSCASECSGLVGNGEDRPLGTGRRSVLPVLGHVRIRSGGLSGVPALSDVSKGRHQRRGSANPAPRWEYGRVRGKSLDSSCYQKSCLCGSGGILAADGWDGQYRVFDREFRLLV